jgi:hypothetical protein
VLPVYLSPLDGKDIELEQDGYLSLTGDQIKKVLK